MRNPKSKETTGVMPMIPLKDMIIFPGMVVPLLVGRAASIAAIEECLTEDVPLFLCAQKDPDVEEPRAREMHRVGVTASILQTLRLPDGTLKVVVEGLTRGRVSQFQFAGDYYTARLKLINPTLTDEDSEETKALVRFVMDGFAKYVRLGQRLAPEVLASVQAEQMPDDVMDGICAYLAIDAEERQKLLDEGDTKKRLEALALALHQENELLELEQQVRDRVREQMERGHREVYLQEQLRVIHQELGGREGTKDEFTELREMITKAKMPKDIQERAERELSRYERLPPMSPESGIMRVYLEWMCEMPWNNRTKATLDLEHAEKALDERHYGLSKVKERILEFLAVQKLNKRPKGPILCLVGPPGVGKTSLGEAVAEAMNRKFVRVSLGGIRDEAEIRGHRRTYIGALPGRIIQNIKTAGVKNPVFMLDEIDKMNVDFRGDPASALLEVLDPAQNQHFSDHYMEVDFDLSEVFFVATANNEMDIPYALYDRLEVVNLPGYTPQEKEAIARQHLIPRQLEACGLGSAKVKLDDAVLELIIDRYTREAGVRELERQLSKIFRKLARELVTDKKKFKPNVDLARAQDMLGPPTFSQVRMETQAEVGVAVGMAWTQSGGDTLQIETCLVPGKGKLVLTGQLGEVMKESAQAAHAYMRSRGAALQLDAEKLANNDMHIHVPEGATPKDGPSAGIALLVSMLSALLGVAPQAAVAFTGEITLRGRVLPVGGIKEKVLAAHRAGIRTIVLPKENEKDFPEVPAEVRDAITWNLVEDASEVVAVAFPEKGNK